MNLKQLLLGEKMPISFTSHFSREVCVNKLIESAAKKRGWTTWDWVGDFGLDLLDNQFKLWKIIRPKGLALRAGNVWNPIYYGKLVVSSNNTLIIGHFAIPLAVQVYFLSLVAILCLLILFFVISQFLFHVYFGLRQNVVFISSGLLLLVFLLGWSRHGILTGRKEYQSIIDFISKVLEATPIESDVESQSAAQTSLGNH